MMLCVVLSKFVLFPKVRCSNGQLGYGRRRRDITEETKENKVYTISMSTIIKMECDDCSKAENVEKGQLWSDKMCLLCCKKMFVFYKPTTYYNCYILGSLREKFEYSSSDEKALSALFEEFGSSKFAYFEGRSNSQTKISASVAGLLVGLILCLVR